MRILCVDIGTGTQDIFLFDSQLDVENGFKLVVPSPTMMVHRRMREATRQGDPILLTGVTMGGGPSQWATEDHIGAGYAVYATPDAARSFNDDLSMIHEMGIQVVSEDETRRLPPNVVQLHLRDFDFAAITDALALFGVTLNDLAAVVVAVFDHGAAPPNYSDRQFRFDYIAERIKAKNHLSTFAFRAANVPAIMTRLQAVKLSAQNVDAPLVLMDTAPAAVMGALLDTAVTAHTRTMVVNIGNFHTLAFRLGPAGIEGTFEHHTGMLDRPKLEGLLRALADGTLLHETVFNDHGHGALITHSEPLDLGEGMFDTAVTGPRRAMMTGSLLRPYFATPFGDMMLTGCFGMLAATANVMPELGPTIQASLASAKGIAPWDVI